MTDKKVIAQHWTPKGVARIEQVWDGKSYWYRLWFGETNLKEYFSPGRAAEALANGERDAELPVKASTLGIPTDWNKWNGLR